jgi:hypothetical protein
VPRDDPARRWDVWIAALALAVLTAGVARLWPGQGAGAGLIVTQAALASMGLVALAARWEAAARALVRDPVGLMLLVTVAASAVWSMAPGETLRAATLFLLVWLFGCGLASRFRPADLAEIAGLAAALALLCHVALDAGAGGARGLSGETGFAVACFGWAALAAPARRAFWLAALAGALVLSVASRDFAGLTALVGGGVGWAVVAAGRKGPMSLIGLGWVLVATIFLATLFVLFGAEDAALAMLRGREALGESWVWGVGFAATGGSLAAALGEGLGVWGVALGLLVAALSGLRALAASLAQAAAHARREGAAEARGAPLGPDPRDGDRGLFPVWCALMGTIAAAPEAVPATGALVAVTAMVGFRTLLRPDPAPARRPLVPGRAQGRPAARPIARR